MGQFQFACLLLQRKWSRCHSAAGTVLCAVLLFCVFSCLPSSPHSLLPQLLRPHVCGRGRGDSSRVAHLPFIISSATDYITSVSPLLSARLLCNLQWSLVPLNQVCKSKITCLVILLFLLTLVLSGFPCREPQRYSTLLPARLPACLAEPRTAHLQVPTTAGPRTCLSPLQRLKINLSHLASSVSGLCLWVLTNSNITPKLVYPGKFCSEQVKNNDSIYSKVIISCMSYDNSNTFTSIWIPSVSIHNLSV